MTALVCITLGLAVVGQALSGPAQSKAIRQKWKTVKNIRDSHFCVRLFMSTLKLRMNQNAVNFSFAEFYLFVYYYRKMQGVKGKVSRIYFKNLCVKSLLTPLQIQFNS